MWFVVRSAAGRQQKAIQELREEGITVYCPMARRETRHRQTKRWLMKEYPLFTGYLFAEMKASTFHKLRDMKHVRGILGQADGTPLPILTSEVLKIKDAQDRGDFDILRPSQRRLQAGDRIEIKDGPLSGHYADITSVVGRRAVKIMADMFGRLVEIELGMDSVRKVA